MENKLRVLSVDDDVGMTKTLADILGLVGHDVVVAQSGPEGIEKARDAAFDCIFDPSTLHSVRA